MICHAGPYIRRTGGGNRSGTANGPASILEPACRGRERRSRSSRTPRNGGARGSPAPGDFEPNPIVFLQANEVVCEIEPVGLALHDFLLPHAGEEAAAEDLLQARVSAFVDELVPQFARAELLHRRRAQCHEFHVEDGAAGNHAAIHAPAKERTQDHHVADRLCFPRPCGAFPRRASVTGFRCRSRPCPQAAW